MPPSLPVSVAFFQPVSWAGEAEVADVIREPLREFFTRLLGVVETGDIPAARPYVLCPGMEN